MEAAFSQRGWGEHGAWPGQNLARVNNPNWLGVSIGLEVGFKVGDRSLPLELYVSKIMPPAYSLEIPKRRSDWL